MTRRWVAPRCSQTINSPYGGRAVRRTSMVLDSSAGSSRTTMKTRSKTAQTASAAARGRSEACMGPWMAEIDHHGVTVKASECWTNRTETVADLQPIRAAQPRDDTEPRSAGHRYRLRTENSRGHRPIAETICKTSIIQSQVEQIRDRATLHVAINQDHGTARRERPRKAGRPRCRSLSGPSSADAQQQTHGVVAVPESPAHAAPQRTCIAASALSGAEATRAPGTVRATCNATFEAPIATHAASSATGTRRVTEDPETLLTTRSCPISTCWSPVMAANTSMVSPAAKGGAVATVIATSGLGGYRNKIITPQDVVDKQPSREQRVNGGGTVHFEVEVCRRSSNLHQLDIVNTVWTSCRDIVGDDPNRNRLRRIGLLCVYDQSKNHDDHRTEQDGSNEPSTTHTMIPSPEHHPAARQERA